MGLANPKVLLIDRIVMLIISALWVLQTLRVLIHRKIILILSYLMGFTNPKGNSDYTYFKVAKIYKIILYHWASVTLLVKLIPYVF